MRTMSDSDVGSKRIEQMRIAYARNVATLSNRTVGEIILVDLYKRRCFISAASFMHGVREPKLIETPQVPLGRKRKAAIGQKLRLNV
jgi:hypothetical protein